MSLLEIRRHRVKRWFTRTVSKPLANNLALWKFLSWGPRVHVAFSTVFHAPTNMALPAPLKAPNCFSSPLPSNLPYFSNQEYGPACHSNMSLPEDNFYCSIAVKRPQPRQLLKEKACNWGFAYSFTGLGHYQHSREHGLACRKVQCKGSGWQLHPD